MTDFNKAKPNAVHPVNDNLTVMRQNAEVIDRSFQILGLMMADSSYIDFSYSGNDQLTTITVSNSGDDTMASCAIAYTGDNIATETWTINGETLVYTYTYSTGRVSNIALGIT